MIPDSTIATIEASDPIQADRPVPREILGVRIDDLSWAEALARIDGFLAVGGPHQVVTPNPELVLAARRDPAFRAVIASADLVTCDGVGLRWAGRLLGQPLREVIPGSELIERMAERGAARGERWFLLGAAEGVAETVGRVLAERYPGLIIAGSHAGSPRSDAAEAIRRRIEAAGPIDALFVAYGSPAQELWIAEQQPRLRIPVAVGVGGAFNFLAGRSRRPPEWVRRAGLIWLFRLLGEPWRWRRQLGLLRFVLLVVGARLRGAGA